MVQNNEYIFFAGSSMFSLWSLKRMYEKRVENSSRRRTVNAWDFPLLCVFSGAAAGKVSAVLSGINGTENPVWQICKNLFKNHFCKLPASYEKRRVVPDLLFCP